MNYQEILDDLAGVIKEGFGPRKVFSFSRPGRFTEKDIRQMANHSPGVLTTFRWIDRTKQELDCCSFVMTSEESQDTPKDILGVVAVLLETLEGLEREWTQDRPRDIKARGLYSGKLGEINTELWVVNYKIPTQEIKVNLGTLGDFEVYEEEDNGHTL